MEIRIKITPSEYEDLKDRSDAVGFPSVNLFARELLFPHHDYKKKWAEAKVFISKLSSGDTFYVRDALPNTPASFGVNAFKEQNDLGIEKVGKDREGINVWRKK